MGDECRKIILNTKGKNDDEVERSLVDFLHYIDHSSEENVPEDCDERLKHLHKKIYEIKSNEQMGVSYMKMEERDRLLVEKGEIMGIVSIVRKVMEKGNSNDKIADILNNIGIEEEYIETVIKAVAEYRDKSDQEIAEMILYHEV